MPIPFIVVLGGAVAAAVATRWWNRPEQRLVQVSWVGEFTSSLLPARVAREVESFFRGVGGCTVTRSLGGRSEFRRGNPRITELPTNREVMWIEVPVSISVEYDVRDGGTVARVQFTAPPEMTFDPACAKFFHQQAEGELDHLLVHLRLACDEPSNRRNDERRRRDRHTHDETPHDRQAEAEAARDYAVLGVPPGADWRQVQAAYRDACHKYHPDRLHNAPPQLIELAVAHFKELTAAYQRLKSRLER